MSETPEEYREPLVDDALMSSGEQDQPQGEHVDQESAGFDERLDDVMSEAGNFLAREVMTDPEANESDRLWGLLAYLSQVIVPIIIPVLMLILDPNKDRPFQRYHGIQSLGFLVVLAVYEVLAGAVFAILTVVTLGCLAAILWILFLVPIVPAIYYGYLAYQGKRFEIPYLTPFMRNQGWL